MSQSAKVKTALEHLTSQKALGASQAEAATTVANARVVCDDPETSLDLRAALTARRRALEAAVVLGDAQAREAALASLVELAAVNVW